MTTFANLSIRRKCLLSVLPIALLSLGAGFGFVLTHFVKEMKQDLVLQTRLISELIGKQSLPYLASRDPDGLIGSWRDLDLSPHVCDFYLFDENDRIFAVHRGSIDPQPDGETPNVLSDTNGLAKEAVHSYYAIFQGGSKRGTMYVSTSTVAMKSRINQIIMKLFLVLATLVVLVVLASSRLSRMIARPLQELSAAANTVSKQGNYDIRVVKVVNDEVGELYDGFNALLERVHKDRVERDEVEKEMHMNEERLKLVIQGSSDGMWNWPDITKDDQWWSSQFYNLLGYSDQEIAATHSHFNELLHPDDRERRDAGLQAHLEHKHVYDVEYRLRSQSGDYRWFRDRGRAVWHDGKTPTRMAGTIQDIHTSKSAGRSLVESEARYRAVFDGSRDAIFISDVNGRFTKVNEAACRLTGYSKDELLQMRIPDLHEEEDLAAYRKYSDKILTGNEIVSEAKILKKNGQNVDVEFSSRRLTVANEPYMHSVARDITLGRQADEELRKSEERFRALFETAQIGIVIGNKHELLDQSNEAFREIFGYSQAELEKLTYKELTHPDDLEMSKNAVRDLRSGRRQKVSIEKRYRHKNGSMVTAVTSIVALYARDGSWRCSFTMVHDITETKRAEEALRLSEELHSDIVESMSDGVVVLDENFHYVHWNRAMEKISKVPREQLIGQKKRPWEIFPLLIDRGVDDMMRQAMSGESVTRENIPFELPDGTVGTTDETFFPLKTASDEIRGVVGVVRNVTERKNAEMALRESEARFRSLYESAAVGLVISDLDERFIQTNVAFQTMMGYTAKEFEKMRFQDITYADDLKAYMKPMADLRAGKLTQTVMENRFVRKDGAIVWASISVAACRNSEGNRLYNFAVVNDVTKRKLFEARLQKLSSVVEQMTDMVMITDKEGYIEYVNPSFETGTGHSKYEVNGKTPAILKSGEHSASFYEKLWKTILDGQVFRAVFTNRHKDGKLYYEEKTIAPLRNAEDQITHFVSTGKDITVRMHAEQALEEGRERISTLLEYAPEAIVILDADAGKFIEANHNAVDLYKLSTNELLEVGLVELSPEIQPDGRASREAIAAKIAEALADGAPRFEWTHCNSLGESIPCEVHLVRLPSRNRNLIRGSVLDITERKRAEEALLASEEKLRSILDTAPDFILTLNTEGTILFLNRTIQNFAIDDAIGTKIFAYMPRSYHPIMQTSLTKVFEDGETDEFEGKATGPDGTLSWYLCRLGPIIRDGEVVAATICATDITKRKQYEEALSSRAYQQAIVAELGQSALAGADLETLINECVSLCSKTLDAELCKFLALDNEGRYLHLTAGVGWHEGLVGKSKLKVSDNTQAGYTLRSKRPVLVSNLATEKRFQGPKLLSDHEVVAGISVIVQGTERPLGLISVHTCKARKFNQDDINFLQAIANVLADAIERKEAEQKIKSSLEEKEVLLKEIHHRVKNNMQVISSLLNLQSGYIEDPQSLEVFKESQNRIRSMALIHEKLYLSKDFAKIDFADYLKNLTSTLFVSYNIRSASINLRIDVKNIVFAIDIAIPCGLIINELVANSLKHAFPNERKGEIVIVIRSRTPNNGKSRTPRHEMMVQDNGIGFPQAMDIDKIESLGLRLVRTLVKQLNGTLKITNKQGAKFTIRF